ncbi:methyltransferase [Pseudoalteromonas sp. T1lg65]|uniref:methyltransferase n=1 Tax=Pseudoalteromonas sp. T1lg65 TaxID=2077101 RepID=UPI003F793874
MQLSNPSLLLLRNDEELIAERILVINHTRDAFLYELQKINPNSDIDVFSYDFADHQHAAKFAGINSHVGHSLPNLDAIDLVIYYYPKSKPEAEMMLDNIRANTSEHTRLLVVGDNKGGVKSVEKQLKDKAQYCYKLDSAKHCILYEFNQLSPLSSFCIEDYMKTFVIKLADREFEAISVPGVFNHGKLDNGTELLLNHITLPRCGDALDFGCGAGLIACFSLMHSPALKFTCLDVNALALFATQQTLALNGFEATLILSNGLSELSGKYDLIFSNPPFHTGLATDYDIAEQFLINIKSFMKKSAKLQLVANRFLKYPDILESNFGSFDITAQNGKFTVYSADY